MAWAVFAGHNATGPYAGYHLGLQSLADNTGADMGVSYGYPDVSAISFMTLALAGVHDDAVVGGARARSSGADEDTAGLWFGYGQGTGMRRNCAGRCARRPVAPAVRGLRGSRAGHGQPGEAPMVHAAQNCPARAEST
jgi:hypothetical protein